MIFFCWFFCFINQIALRFCSFNTICLTFSFRNFITNQVIEFILLKTFRRNNKTSKKIQKNINETFILEKYGIMRTILKNVMNLMNNNKRFQPTWTNKFNHNEKSFIAINFPQSLHSFNIIFHSPSDLVRVKRLFS